MAAGYAGSPQGSFGRPGLPCSRGRAQQNKGLAQAHRRQSLEKHLPPQSLVQQALSTAPGEQGTVRRAFLRGSAAQGKK